MASHNDLGSSRHIPDFPEQSDITDFLRSLLGNGRTQVTWSADAKIPYNTLTNWFTRKPPLMSAEAFLRLVIAAKGSEALSAWLANYGGTWHTGGPPGPSSPPDDPEGDRPVNPQPSGPTLRDQAKPAKRRKAGGT